MATLTFKRVLSGVVLSLVLAAPSQAQNTPAKIEEYGRGTLKMKAGAVLMGAGVFLIFTTPGAENIAAPAAMGTGMGLVLWGAKERSNAMKPHTAFGVQWARSKTLYFSRRW